MSGVISPIRRSVPRLALNQQEAAEALGMSVDSFDRHVKPHVPYVFVGARKLYSVNALQSWFDDHATLHGRRVA